MKKHLQLFGILIPILLSCETNMTTKVTTNERIIEVNNIPYLIKGICYHPVPKGETKRSFNTLEEDLLLMQEAGINTIRVYAPIDDETILNQIHAAGIKLIVGFGYRQEEGFDIASGTVLDYVSKYKNHPAILMWELGNEYNYHPEWFEGDIDNWYNAMSTTAKSIKKIDDNHPVATAHGEIPTTEVLSQNPEIDVWGVNVYRWDQPETLIEEWKNRGSKPLYFSEAGADSYMTIDRDAYSTGVNEQAQSDATDSILSQILSKRKLVSGVTLFSFTDGWWKAENPSQQDIGGIAPNSTGVPYDGVPNEEFWGIVKLDRTKKKAFEVVRKKYTEQYSIYEQ
jgi:hypothetical protein